MENDQDPVAKRYLERMNSKPKPARELYNEGECFEKARLAINTHYGIDLTIIEQYHLKKELSDSLDGLDQFKKVSSRIRTGYDPVAEAIYRFMKDYYGLPNEFCNLVLKASEYSLSFLEDGSFKEYMKMQQEKFHLP